MRNKKKYILFLAIVLIAFMACNSESNNQVVQNNIDTVDLENNFEQATKIFYNLPSPPDVADLLLANSSVEFNLETLNKVGNIDLYESSAKQALNLGIYSTDFSFASLSGQDQIAINYLANSKKLAKKLGIVGVLGQDTIQWLARNFENKDSLMGIITLVYRRSEAYFNDNGKGDLALLMAIGGWTEGLFIATQLAEKMEFSVDIMDKIAEQRLSMDIILQIIESNLKEPNIIIYRDGFKKLNEKYLTYNKMLSDDLKDGGEISELTIAEFRSLAELVQGLRNQFTN
ncbi:MAG: hypothetical protein KAI79_03695 [Bacteroidales bacterium]|nr:hypothetical protein [Bacteroidales bacterium]